MAKRTLFPFVWKMHLDTCNKYHVLWLKPAQRDGSGLDQYLWESNPAYFHKHLCVRAQCNVDAPENWYSFDFGMDTTCMNMLLGYRECEALHKTQNRIGKAYERIERKMGYPQTLAQRIIYLSQAIGKECEGHIMPYPCMNHGNIYDNADINFSINSLIQEKTAVRCAG